MKANREEEYPVFFHVIHPAEVLKISVFGDIELSYFGFGDESKEGRVSIKSMITESQTCMHHLLCVCEGAKP